MIFPKSIYMYIPSVYTASEKLIMRPVMKCLHFPYADCSDFGLLEYDNIFTKFFAS